MAISTARSGRHRMEGKGVFRVLAGAAFVVIGGFAVGLISGLILEEPGLVVDYLSGRTTPVAMEKVSAGSESASRSGTLPESSVPLPDQRVGRRETPGRSLRKPAVDVASAPPRSGFAIQVGAFSDEGAARKLVGQLRQGGLASYVSAGQARSQARWRVRVGPVSTRQEAERLAARLQRQEKLPTWILSEEPR